MRLIVGVLERTVGRYKLKETGVTFFTPLTLEELHFPITIERDDLELLGVYEIKAIKARETRKDG
jgi:hypothetical protein